MAVPKELAHELLAISGRHGLIIDIARRDVKEKHEQECASIRLPEEWSIKDVLKKYEDQPKQAKEVSRGIVPTRRGFALKVGREAERDVFALIISHRGCQTWASVGDHA